MTAVNKKQNSKPVRISQTDIPKYTLEEALRVSKAIVDNYAGDPTPPLNVAQALDLGPTGSQFKMLSGSSIAYGLTIGGYNAGIIEITPLARRILKPVEEGDDHKAKVEALLKPRIVSEFLTKYNGSPLPKEDIAKNVLETMGSPASRTNEVLDHIIEGAETLGLIIEIKGKKYIDLKSGGPITTAEAISEPPEGVSINSDNEKIADDEVVLEFPNPKSENLVSNTSKLDTTKTKRVFITHGKNKSLVEPIKQLLVFGEMEPVVSVEKQSTSKPVPDKVMEDMRSCGAAIIHVEGEETLLGNDGEQRIVLNPNVLIEIGAAMALYGKRFILLTKQGVKLPSNLQGLYEVRYSDDALDGDATIRLLKAINEMKNTK